MLNGRSGVPIVAACAAAWLLASPAPRAAIDLLVDSTAPLDFGGCHGEPWSGDLDVVVTNAGDEVAPLPIEIVVFEDEDRDSVFNPAVDEIYAMTSLGAPLAARESRALRLLPAGQPIFRGAPLVVFIDSGDAHAETDEANNLLATSSACQRSPPPGVFDPEVEWHWDGEAVDSTPLAGDVTADGRTDVVFIGEDGLVRCLDGADGTLHWVTSAPAAARWSTPAIGDIDGDPGLETVVLADQGSTNVLLAFDDDGSHLWTSAGLSMNGGRLGAVSLADLDCDGTAEAIYENHVVNAADGSLFWTPEAGGTLSRNSGFSGMSVAVDVDGDGDLEVVAGPTAYDYDAGSGMGRILWTQPSIFDGNAAVGNFDDDDAPEIALTGQGVISLLEGDTGDVIWTQLFPVGGGGCSAFSARVGAPTVADFDGDGEPEIGASGADWYAVFEGDGTELWRSPIDDCSSHFTASTVFDFEADGSAEVVYQDEVAIRVLRGTDGMEIASLPASSLTWQEMATIADIDGDGNAEILSPLNPHRSSTLRGVRAWGDVLDNWVSARSIWNQHAYHVGHVGDDGRVGAGAGTCEEDSWLTHGTYRRQLAGGRDGLAAPNLTVTILSETVVPGGECGKELELLVRVGNAGSATTGTVVELGAFDSDPATGGALADSALVPALAPGQWHDVTFTLTVPAIGLGPVHVLVDDDGTGPSSGVVSECREDDNACVASRVPGGGDGPRPEAVGPALRATGHGPATDPIVTADFEWSGDLGAPRPDGDHFHLWWSRDPARLELLAAEHPHVDVTWVDATPRAASLPAVTFLRVFAADTCELEELR